MQILHTRIVGTVTVMHARVYAYNILCECVFSHSRE
jgi:hypothetical protein